LETFKRSGEEVEMEGPYSIPLNLHPTFDAVTLSGKSLYTRGSCSKEVKKCITDIEMGPNMIFLSVS
jgi:hypothetical protein